MSGPTASFHPPGPALSCSTQSHGRDARWVRLAGELDIAGAAWCEQALNDALRVAVLVILDLRELEFIDSAGARVLDQAAARARRNRRRLVILRGGAQVEIVLALAGVIDRLEIVDLKPVLLARDVEKTTGV